MQISFAHLCDHALIDQQNKLSIIGVFGVITTQNVPTLHAGSYLAFEIQLNPAELNRRFPLRIELVDEDGAKLMEANANIEVGGTAKLGETPRVPQVLPLPPIKFEREGPHSFNFWLNDIHSKHIDFEVRTVDPGTAGS